jgi:hypothetical protein
MVKIIQGEDKTITVRIDGESGDPVDLTNLTEASACFKLTDRTFLDVLLSSATANGSQISVVSAVLGKLQIALQDTDTATFSPGSSITLELTLTLDGAIRKIQIPRAYEVVGSFC